MYSWDNGDTEIFHVHIYQMALKNVMETLHEKVPEMLPQQGLYVIYINQKIYGLIREGGLCCEWPLRKGLLYKWTCYCHKGPYFYGQGFNLSTLIFVQEELLWYCNCCYKLNRELVYSGLTLCISQPQVYCLYRCRAMMLHCYPQIHVYLCKVFVYPGTDFIGYLLEHEESCVTPIQEYLDLYEKPYDVVLASGT